MAWSGNWKRNRVSTSSDSNELSGHNDEVQELGSVVARAGTCGSARRIRARGTRTNRLHRPADESCLASRHEETRQDISAEWQYDPSLKTEIEVRFIADGKNRTRVELEHRRLDRYGARRDEMRTIFDSTGDWGRLLESFANAAAA